MSYITRLFVISAGVLMLGVFGCKPKPVAAPKSEPKLSDGPLLAPPQQPSTPPNT
jgi:hypothetical protein